MTKSQMEQRIAELEEENEDLQSRLDSIVDIVQPGASEPDDEERMRMTRIGTTMRTATALRK